MIAWPEIAYALIIGYLLGSIPFGLIFTRLSGAGDIRTIGSGATGATNVLRTGKYGAAAATLIFDAAKGIAAVLIVHHFWGETAAATAAVGAILGHLFPIWLRFKGGKGVATSLGVLLTLYWPVALLSLATWFVVAAITRISSLSALVAAVAAPIYMFVWGQTTFAVATLIIALLVLVAHRENIKRLLAGTEPRIGKSK
ncbi:MAG: glycerol-3-phosphate 1-O-acyltransferase PlsY [Rhizomicrobium sp.]